MRPSYLSALTVVIVFIFLFGCVSQPVQTQTPNDTASLNPHPCPASNYTPCTKCTAGSPTDAELQQIVTNFDAYAEKARKDWNVSGMSIAIVKGDKVILLKGYGTKAAGGNDPVTPDTIFQIASNSKAFTSTLIGMEVDKGALNWDDKVVTYLPDFQMNDSWVTKEMTITDLMAHRSGLSDHWGDELMYIGYNETYLIHTLRYVNPVSSFRSKFAYQNMVYSVPSQIVEKISNKTWPENLKEMIFTPLGMENTSADPVSFANAKDVAVPYVYDTAAGDSLVPFAIPANSTMNSMGYHQPGAAGINSNARDMSRWLIFQMGNGSYNGKQLISTASLNYVHSPKMPMSDNMQQAGFYTQGWIYQDTQFGQIITHSGAINGFHSVVTFLPKEKVGIVILTNNVESSLADALNGQFFLMYYGNSTSDLSADMLNMSKSGMAKMAAQSVIIPANSSLPLSAYAGNYTQVEFGTAVVAMENGNLTATLGPAKIKLQLVPLGGNRFAHVGNMFDNIMLTSNPMEFGIENGTPKNMTLQLNNGNVTFEKD